jgi:hypothetical protein
MIPIAQPDDGFAYAVIIPDQSFASFAALASKVLLMTITITMSISNSFIIITPHNHHTAPAAPGRNSLPFVDLMLPQVPLQQHLSDDRLLFLRCSRVTITPDAQNPIGYNVDGQSIPPVTLQITAGVERVDFVTNPPPATSK